MNYVNELNQAYEYLYNAIDMCKTKADFTALLDKIESSELPYADILYARAFEIYNIKF
jgi:hypothetical protein